MAGVRPRTRLVVGSRNIEIAAQELTQQRAKDLARAKEAQVAKFMSDYFSNTLLSVRDILNQPGIPVTSGKGQGLMFAARRPTRIKIPRAAPLVSVRTTKSAQAFSQEKVETMTVASGLADRFRWKPLTKRWINTGARQGFKSREYWKKTGKLASIYRGTLPRTLSVTRNSANYHGQSKVLGERDIRVALRSGLFSPKATATNATIIRLNLRRPKIHAVLEEILLNPFFYQDVAMEKPPAAHSFSDLKGGVTTISRLRYPEYYRPWLRRFALMMGRRMRADLKKL